MSKPATQLSTTALVVNLALCVLTVVWCIPFGIYVLMAWSTKRKPSLMLVALHSFLTFVTMPLYGIALIAYYLYKKK